MTSSFGTTFWREFPVNLLKINNSNRPGKLWSYHISSEYTFSFSCLPQWARKYRKSSYSAVFFQKWDRDWIVDPIFRQGLRLTRVLKEGLRLDFRSHFKAGIENGL